MNANRTLKTIVRALWAAACLPFAVAPAAPAPYHERADVKAYVDELVSHHSLERAAIEDMFRRATRQERVIEAMDRPAEALPWHQYRDIFLTDARVAAGVRYWREHRGVLERAAARFSVPPRIILAILGVETLYGTHTGGFPVFDTLATLGFDYPRRAAFFRRELTEFLLLCRDDGIDCAALAGSYAGAMGFGQFIPSSYRAYAIDFDGDGARDLWSAADAIGSIANYLVRHGWDGDAPLGEYVEIGAGDYEALLNRELKPWLSASDLAGRGVRVDGFTPREPQFALFDFLYAEGDRRIWVGYNNFYVITRYNTSRRYAMAVHRLGQLIRRAYRDAE